MFNINLFQKQIDLYKQAQDDQKLESYLKEMDRQLQIEPMPFTFTCFCEIGQQSETHEDEMARWTQDWNYRKALISYEYGNLAESRGDTEAAAEHYKKAHAILNKCGLKDRPLF